MPYFRPNAPLSTLPNENPDLNAQDRMRELDRQAAARRLQLEADAEFVRRQKIRQRATSFATKFAMKATAQEPTTDEPDVVEGEV